MMKRFGFLIVIASLLFLTMCSKKENESDVSSEDVKQEARETIEAAKSYTLQEKQEYQREIENKLDDFGNRINELKTKASTLTAQAKAEVDKEIEELQKSKDELDKKLEELRTASDDAWEDIKSGIDKAMENLRESYDEASSHFQ